MDGLTGGGRQEREELYKLFGVESDTASRDETPTAEVGGDAQAVTTECLTKYVVQHPRQYPEGGIINSVPIFMAEKTDWRNNKQITQRYEELNRVYQLARTAGRKDHRFLSENGTLGTDDKKLLANRLKTGRDIIIPARMDLVNVYPESRTGRKGGAAVRLFYTKEMVLEVGDADDIPNGLEVALLLRFADKKGKGWFRLGWTQRDEGRARRARKAEKKKERRNSGEES